MPSYLFDKQNIYSEGIKNLKKKKCRINLILFPTHSSLSQIIKSSQISIHTDKFFENMIDLAGCSKVDTLILNDSNQPFHDLIHLNTIGSSKISNFLSTRLEKRNSNAFTILHSYLKE